MRSREWKQLWSRDDNVASLCNELDADGWSIHSVTYTGAKVQGTRDAAILILAWRAIAPTTPATMDTPFR